MTDIASCHFNFCLSGSIQSPKRGDRNTISVKGTMPDRDSRDKPGLIPNPEVKPANVSCCTEVRESPGTIPSCYHLSFLQGIFVFMKFY